MMGDVQVPIPNLWIQEKRLLRHWWQHYTESRWLTPNDILSYDHQAITECGTIILTIILVLAFVLALQMTFELEFSLKNFSCFSLFYPVKFWFPPIWISFSLSSFAIGVESFNRMLFTKWRNVALREKYCNLNLLASKLPYEKCPLNSAIWSKKFLVRRNSNFSAQAETYEFSVRCSVTNLIFE